MEEVHDDAVQREPIIRPVPDNEAVGLEIIQHGQYRIAPKIPGCTEPCRQDRAHKQPQLRTAGPQRTAPVGFAAVVQCQGQHHRCRQQERRMEYHELFYTVDAPRQREQAGDGPKTGQTSLFRGLAAQQQPQHRDIKECIDQIVPAVDGIHQIPPSKGPDQHAGHPGAQLAQPRTAGQEVDNRPVQGQRQRHAQGPCQMPVIGEYQQSQPIKPLHLQHRKFCRVMPVGTDDAAFLIEQVGQNHFGRQVRIHDPAPGHQLVPQVQQIARRDPQPWQYTPQTGTPSRFL